MILVIAEQRDGTLNRATWETIAAAQQAGGPVKIAVPGSGVDGIARELAAADVAEVVAVDSAPLAEYTADGYVQALGGLIEQERPDLVFLPHTYQTRDFAPALAARLGREYGVPVARQRVPRSTTRAPAWICPGERRPPGPRNARGIRRPGLLDCCQGRRPHGRSSRGRRSCRRQRVPRPRGR